MPTVVKIQNLQLQVKDQVMGKGLYTTAIIATKTLQGRSVLSVLCALILTYV